MGKKKKPTISQVINTRTRPDYEGIRLTRSDAIKRYCLDCTGFQPKEVRECPDTKCPLYRYRLGKEADDGLKPPSKRVAKK